MKKTFLKFAAVAAAACLATVAQAVPISGNIGFTGQAILNTTSVGTATEVVSWANTAVNGDSGSFASIALNAPATFTTPWTFNSGALANFWTAGGFTFNLTSSFIAAQSSDFLAVSGTGVVSGNGFTATTIDWSFTTQNPPATGTQDFTFSASSSNVPDGGTTVAMLGGAVMTLGLIRRKLVAA